jgi:hypothetical protein
MKCNKLVVYPPGGGARGGCGRGRGMQGKIYSSIISLWVGMQTCEKGGGAEEGIAVHGMCCSLIWMDEREIR